MICLETQFSEVKVEPKFKTRGKVFVAVNRSAVNVVCVVLLLYFLHCTRHTALWPMLLWKQSREDFVTADHYHLTSEHLALYFTYSWKENKETHFQNKSPHIRALSVNIPHWITYLLLLLCQCLNVFRKDSHCYSHSQLSIHLQKAALWTGKTRSLVCSPLLWLNSTVCDLKQSSVWLRIVPKRNYWRLFTVWQKWQSYLWTRCILPHDRQTVIT